MTCPETIRATDCPGQKQCPLSFEGHAVIYGERVADEARGRLRVATEQRFDTPSMFAPWLSLGKGGDLGGESRGTGPISGQRDV